MQARISFMPINSTTGLSNNTLSVNKRTLAIAAEVADAMPYVKASRSYMKETDLKGKKYGKTYTIYIPSPGTAVDGVVADPDAFTETTITVTLDNVNTSINLDAWNRFSELTDFDTEVGRPKGVMLAKKAQRKIINSTYTQSLNAVVGDVSLATLSAGAAVIRDEAVPGELSTFINPKIAAEISAAALGKFIPSEEMKDIYRAFYLGEYGDSSIVNIPGLPVVSTTGIISAAATIALTATLDSESATIGYAEINSVTGTGLKTGWAFTVAGLKVVGVDGVETDNDAVVILGTVNAAGTSASISSLRIAVGENRDNNPNAYVSAAFGTATASLVPLAAFTKEGASTTYSVGIARENDALAFDQYTLCDKLPGGEFSSQEIDGITIELSTWGYGKDLSSLVRADLAFAAAIPDSRRQCIIYFAK